ncbi:MAG: homoserine kinase [Rhodospirillales bacterium]|nr:homoserine kinase [Rhodospirillales bacterium]MBO6785647.1 homoserine kinase [Rhodospirillales bacterium]
MAVYTEIDDDALIDFIAGYDIGEVLSCKGIAEGIENSNFIVTTTTGPYILTLYEKRVRIEDLPFFLGLMDHAAAHGIPCPVPLRTTAGETLRELADRPAAVVSFLAGMWPRRPTAEHCREVGEALARFHLAADGFQMRRENALGPTAWRELIEASGDGADEVKPGLAASLSGTLDSLLADWPDELPTGVIHADLFPDNVFFRSEHLSGLIDFYFACNDILAYDIAVCLNAWCFEPDLSFNVTKARRLLRGYQGVRPLARAEIEAMPLLAQGAAMRFLVTRLYDWLHTPEDAFVTPKDPVEYIKRLEFHQGVRGPESYGID